MSTTEEHLNRIAIYLMPGGKALESLKTLRATIAEMEQQLAQSKEFAKSMHQEVMERESEDASICPEGVGIVEYVGVLQKQIAAFTKTPDVAEWETLVRLAYADGGDGALRINRITSEYNRVREQNKTLTTKLEDLGALEFDKQEACVDLSREVDRLTTERDQARVECEGWKDDFHDERKRIDVLEAALREARTNMGDWAAYASDYFRDKHDLAGDLALIDAALRAGLPQQIGVHDYASLVALVERYFREAFPSYPPTDPQNMLQISFAILLQSNRQKTWSSE